MRKDLHRILQLRFVPKAIYVFRLINAIIIGFAQFLYGYASKELIHKVEIGDAIGLRTLSISFIVIVVFLLIYRFATKSFGVHLFQRTFANMLSYNLREFTKKSNNVAEKIGTGKLMSILMSGSSASARLLIDISVKFVGQVTVAILNIGFLASISLDVMWGAYALLILLIIIGLRSSNFAVAYRKEGDELWHERNRHATKVIMSKAEVLMSDNIEKETQKLESFASRIIKTRNKESLRMFPIQNLTNGAIDLYKYVLVMFIGLSVISNNASYSLSDVAGIFAGLGLLANIVNSITDYISSYKSDLTPAKKLWEFMDETEEVLGYNTGLIFAPKEGEITMKDLTFDYASADVLRSFNVTFAGSKKTALVGASGSGKSTIMKLIAGYIHAISGSVMIDNQSLPTPDRTAEDRVSLKSYYPHIGYLTQEPNVFDGTIRENLIYATSGDVTDEQLNNALEQSQCQFVFEFPNGLDTEIGEKGIRLSGGQRQRLAIAKIMLKNPKIVLLDEPTSALDSISEEAITKALDNLFQGRTVVIVAHRLQTVKKADDIIVLDKGRIIERGTHDELVKQSGQYAKMLELQSGF